MLSRAIVVWLVLLVIASVNGAVRELLLIPRIGAAAGRAVSSLLLSAFILGVTWLTIEWIGPSSSRDAWRVGVLWVVLTLAFEFLGGHYLFGSPWPNLLADYNLFQGRIWVLVLIVTAIAPRLCAPSRRR
jgi:hypothetical protein